MQKTRATLLRRGGKVAVACGFLLMSPASALCTVAVPAYAESAAERGSATAERDGAASRIVSFNIPAQDLATALLALARQVDVQLVVNSTYLQGLRSTPVIGLHSTRRATEIMLKGLPLSAAWVGSNTLVIERRTVPAEAKPFRGASLIPADQDSRVESGQPADEGEIIVTATRRSERLQDVPMTITALSGDQLQGAGILSTQQLSQVIPGLNFTQSGSYPQPTIRGIGTRGVTAGDESVVPVYVDGVYQPMLGSTVMELNSVERVEVLKGPQGALLGRNAMGGAINVITRTPSPDPGMDFSVSYGSFHQVIAKGYVTGGTERFAVDLAALYNNDEGYITNIVTGARQGENNSYSVRSKALWTPTDNLKLTLSGSYAKSSSTLSATTQPLSGNTIARRFNPLVALPRGPFESAVTDIGPAKLGVTNLSNLVAWEGSKVTINSVSGYQSVHNEVLNDSDGTAQRVAISSNARDSRSFIQELYAVSTGGGPLSWIVGGTYFYDKSSTNTDNLSTAFPSRVATRTVVSGQVVTNSFAAWAQLSLNLTDALNLSMGGRYTHDKKNFDIVNNVSLATISTGKSWSKFTPTATLKYELSPRSNVYLKVGQAFKAGIYASSTFSPTPADPETVTQYEIGTKTELASWIRINAATYYTDYKDVQVNVRDPITLAPRLQNAAAARIYGFDGDVFIRPGGGLTLRAGISLLNGRYRDYANAQVFGPTGLGGNNATFIDASGKTLIRSPSFTGNIGADYTLKLASGAEIAASVNYFHSGISYWEASNRVVQPSTNVLNAQISLLEASRHVRFEIWGTNLLDEEYPLSIVSSTAADSQFFARPRSVGVRMAVEFR